MTLTLAEITHALSDRKITVVAERTGLSLGTLYAIQRGTAQSVRSTTLERLSRYLSSGE